MVEKENLQNCFLYNNCNHKDCDCFCPRKYKLDILYKNSLLSDHQRKKIDLKVDLDGTDYNEFVALSNIEKNIEVFIEEGKNLYIHSSTSGNGKSSWAIRMVQAYLNEIWPSADLECKALFISVPRFLLALKENIGEKNDYANYIKENIYKADLVVWDDIATKMGTEYEINQLLSFIDGRLALGKSNIYTSNLNLVEMAQALGQRIASRIGNAVNIELKGKDKRSQSFIEVKEANK